MKLATAAFSLAIGGSVLAGCGGSAGSPPTSPGATAAAAPACGIIGGSATLSASILNGAACTQASTSVVLVNSRDRNGQAIGACSGTVIDGRAVLTAAHCLSGEVAAVRIWPGTGPELPADSFAASPLYRPNESSSAFDVGVVITGESIGRAPMRILTSRDVRVGEQAAIAGWGRDQNGVGTVLRAGLTTIGAVDPTSLQTQFSSAASSVCQGDSGGPLLVQEGGVWAIGGITSAVTQSGSCTAGTNFYANVRNPSVASFVLGLVPNAGRQ